MADAADPGDVAPATPAVPATDAKPDAKPALTPEQLSEISDALAKAVNEVPPPKMKSAAVRAGLLFTAAFVVGYFAMSVFWMLGLISMVAFDTYRKNRAQTLRDRARIARQAHSSDHLMALLGDLPPWITFADTEKSTALNDLFEKLWPYAKKATELIIKGALDPILAQYRPVFLTVFGLHKCDLGNKPPQILGVNTIVSKGQVCLDFTIKKSGDSDVVIAAGASFASLKVKVQDLEVTGTMRIILSPLCNSIPGFKAVSATFTSKPNITFKLNAVGAPITSIPKLGDFLEDFITDTLGGILVHPIKIVAPLLKEGPNPEEEITPLEMLELYNTSAAGMLRVKVISATNLKNTDKFGKSDPYTSLSCGGQKKRTSVIQDNLNPVWDQTFDWLISDPASQRLDLTIKDDDIGRNALLGEVSIGLSNLMCDEKKVMTLPLENGQGEVCLELEYKPFVMVEADSSITPGAEWEASSKLANGALFAIIKRAIDLPGAKGHTVKLQLGDGKGPHKASWSSWAVTGTDPAYEQMKTYPLMDVAADPLFVTFDDNPPVEIDLAKEVLLAGTKGMLKTIDLPKGGKLEIHLIVKYVDANAIPHEMRGMDDEDGAGTNEEMSAALSMQKQFTVSKVAVRAAALLMCVYFGAYFLSGYLVLSVLLAVACGVHYTYDAHKRVYARFVLENERSDTHIDFNRESYKEDTAGLATLKERLPSWFTHPDVEKVEWLNEFLEALWPHLAAAGRKMILAQVQPILDAKKPGFLDALTLKVVRLGKLPPLITGLRHYNPKALGERFMMDLDLQWATDMTISVMATKGPLHITVTVRDVSLTGPLRVELNHLITSYPCFAGMNISFTQRPKIDLNVSLAGLPLMSLPALHNGIFYYVNDLIASLLVYPTAIEIPIIQDITDDMLIEGLGSAPPGAGVLRVRIIKAVDLRNVELTSKSDPYVSMILTDIPAVKQGTKVISNNLNPVWPDENFEFIVKDPNSVLKLLCKDYDKVGKNTLLGETEVAVSSLHGDVRKVHELPLVCKKKTKHKQILHVELTWKPFTSTVITSPPVEHSNKRWATATVFVNVISCRDLKIPAGNKIASIIPGSKKLTGGSKPYVTVSVGNVKQKTAQSEGANPVFHEVLTFFVVDVQNQNINVSVHDSDLGKDTALGSYKFSMRDVTKSGKLTDTWHLQNTSHGEITLGIFLRTVGAVDLSDSEFLRIEEEKASAAAAAAELAAVAAAKEGEASSEAASVPRSEPVAPVIDPETLPNRAGYVTVNINRARNLPGVDSDGFSDPYVTMHCEGHKQKTKTMKRNLNPIYEETFQFRVKDPATAELDFHVKDAEGMLRKGRMLGEFKIPIKDIGTELVPGGKQMEQKLGANGSVLLTLSYANDPRPKKQLAVEDKSSKKKKSGSFLRRRKSKDEAEAGTGASAAGPGPAASSAPGPEKIVEADAPGALAASPPRAASAAASPSKPAAAPASPSAPLEL